eukprot:jgi/Undpi1/7346/HiC_scaffold_22.g09819.m1
MHRTSAAAGAAAAAAAAAGAAPTSRRRRSLTRPSSGTAAAGSTTALHATGFGPPPAAPKPSAYYPNDDEDDHERAAGAGGGSEDQQQPFPGYTDTRKVEEPRGIGTLFEKEDEVIRELSSDEFLDIMRDWAPVASFAAQEAADGDIKEEAADILTVLRGMAEWQPKRSSDFTKLGSKWSFGAPIGAIKGGQVDALACLQVSEDEGVVVEWICGNPVTLGIPGNAVDWLSRGVESLCGKRLELPVTIAQGARGGDRGRDSASSGGGGGGGGGGRGGKGKAGEKNKTNRSSGGKKKGAGGGGAGGAKKRR